MFLKTDFHLDFLNLNMSVVENSTAKLQAFLWFSKTFEIVMLCISHNIASVSMFISQKIYYCLMLHIGLYLVFSLRTDLMKYSNVNWYKHAYIGKGVRTSFFSSYANVLGPVLCRIASVADNLIRSTPVINKIIDLLPWMISRPSF